MDFLRTSWNMLWNIGTTSEEFQTDQLVILINVGIFSWGTSGRSEGTHIVTCRCVLVKFKCHTRQNLWELFCDGLRKQRWTFWGNLRESLRFQASVEIFQKSSQGFIQVNMILQVMEFPGILGDFQEEFEEYLRHTMELSKGLRVS